MTCSPHRCERTSAILYILLNSIVFLAAFLIFFIELIIAKAILPNFGGSYLVWSTCVLFFQGILLLGYLYAYSISRRLQAYQYQWLHLLIMALPFFLFPVEMQDFTPVNPSWPFSVHIITILSITIGPAFFILTSISIYIQNWLAQSELRQRKNPYVLYATSNLGAFTAILGYPVVFERLLTLSSQLIIWQIGYALLFLLHLVLIRHRISDRQQAFTRAEATGTTRSGKEKLRWVLLSASASAMFLSVTNVITFDLASVPLLWIFPLSIYLFTFILTFKHNAWYPKFMRDRFGLAVMVGVFLFLLMIQSYKLPLLFVIPLHLFILFVICLNVHGKLYELKPSRPHNLSAYYIYIALGGFLGSLLVSWLAPFISYTLIEYVLSLGIATSAFHGQIKFRKVSASMIFLMIVFSLTIMAWPHVIHSAGLSNDSLWAIVFGLILCIILYIFYSHPPSFLIALLIVMIASSWLHPINLSQNTVRLHRNFYGTYHIYDQGNIRYLRHGTTLHGSQYTSGPKQNHPLTYYHVTTPVGEVLDRYSDRFSTIAIIGLGAGSLAVYGKSDQSIDIFELDPDIETFAKTYFTFLEQSQSQYTLITGDARLSLQEVRPGAYNILIVDAFNSDAIPVHLLTVEALRLYKNCILDSGIILFHISNKYLNLAPVFKANSLQTNTSAFYKNNLKNFHADAQACEWVALTTDSVWIHILTHELDWTDLKDNTSKSIQPWTDQYSNIISVMK